MFVGEKVAVQCIHEYVRGQRFCAIECLRVHRTGRETHDSEEMSKRIVVTSDVTPFIIVWTSVSTKVGSSSLSSCDCKFMWACV